jgi:hypothetical protein
MYSSSLDYWTSAFTPMVDDTCQRKGYAIPSYVKPYLVELMSYWAERTDFTPDPSFAERYMTLAGSEKYKEFADQCLFCVSLFPELGQRRGIPTSYYAGLGSSAYWALAQYQVHVKLFTTLSIGFELCSKVIGETVRQNSDQAVVKSLLF